MSALRSAVPPRPPPKGKPDEHGNVQPTMIFAAREGSEVTIQMSEGFVSNGMTVLDDSHLSGSFTGGPGMIVQDSSIETYGVAFSGEITVVNQVIGREADGMTFNGDAEVDSLIPLSPDGVSAQADGINTIAGVEPGYVTTGDDQKAYRDHIAEITAHELGENFADTGVQHHSEDIIGKMHDDLTAAWDAEREAHPDQTREEFTAAHREASAFQDGINDAAVEAGHDAGGYDGRVSDAWKQFSQVRYDHQLDTQKNQTSGETQRVLGKAGGGLNAKAMTGLLPKTPDEQKTADDQEMEL